MARLDVSALPDHVLDALADSDDPAENSYSAINENPATDSTFSTAYDAIRLAGVDGDIEITDGQGNTQVISQKFLAVDEIIPIKVQEIKSANTTQTVSDIMLLRI